MRKITVAAFVVGLVAVNATSAGAERLLRTERVYFTCADDTKVQNASAAQGRIPSWSTQAPTQSVQQGAGCGYYDNAVWISSVLPSEMHRTTWEGTFTGNLDSLTIEAHNIYVGGGRVSEVFEGAVEVTVDGAIMARDFFSVTPQRSETGLSEAIVLSIAGLGLVAENGEGTFSRTVRVDLSSSGETQSAWVWDTTEVPSGITFNPESLADTVVTPGG
jgi:hypothetical protein